jgi:hypothetical protein
VPPGLRASCFWRARSNCSRMFSTVAVLAMVRQLQWVMPKGWVWRVASMSASRLAWSMRSLRPRPGAISHADGRPSFWILCHPSAPYGDGPSKPWQQEGRADRWRQPGRYANKEPPAGVLNAQFARALVAGDLRHPNHRLSFLTMKQNCHITKHMSRYLREAVVVPQN